MNTKILVIQSRELYFKIFRLVELECMGKIETLRCQKLRAAFIHAHARFRRRQLNYLAVSVQGSSHAKSL